MAAGSIHENVPQSTFCGVANTSAFTQHHLADGWLQRCNETLTSDDHYHKHHWHDAVRPLVTKPLASDDHYRR
jgi:hypothetical protein